MMGNHVGALFGVWRYPVKSMMGDALGSSIVWERGLLGDRSYALIDQVTGKIASAKNPRKWPALLRFSAAYTEPPLKAAAAPVRITLPNGEFVRRDQEDADHSFPLALMRAWLLNPKRRRGPSWRSIGLISKTLRIAKR